MRRLLAMASALCALSAGLSGAASAAEDPVPAEDLIAQLPKEMFGAPALRTSGSWLITYFPKEIGKTPIVGVVAQQIETPRTFDEMREETRRAYHETGIRQIFREGTFTTSRFPGARTFYGEYLAGSGLKQSWVLETGTQRLAVVATYFRKQDSDLIGKEIARSIFPDAVVQDAGQVKP